MSVLLKGSIFCRWSAEETLGPPGNKALCDVWVLNFVLGPSGNKALCHGWVLNLVLSVLQSNSITIEEFHHSLQDVTNFPLRPFVVPFLRAHLPILQRELSNLARLAKQVSAELALSKLLRSSVVLYSRSPKLGLWPYGCYTVVLLSSW